jgi:hypothetical protein
MALSDSTNRPVIGLADVLAARERVNGAIYYSPCPHSQMLSGLTGAGGAWRSGGERGKSCAGCGVSRYEAGDTVADCDAAGDSAG